MNAPESIRDKIRHIARQQLIQGTRPSQTSIRDTLGPSSSNTTIAKALTEFWAEIGAELESNESRPDIPDQVFSVAAKVWEAALKASNKTCEDRIAKAIGVETRARDSQEAAEKQLEQERARGNDSQKELDHTKALLEKERSSAKEMSELLYKAQRAVADLTDQLRSTITKNDDARTAYDKRIDALLSNLSSERSKIDKLTEKLAK